MHHGIYEIPPLKENKTVNECFPLSLHIFVSCETKSDQLLLCPIYIEDQALIALCLLPMILERVPKNGQSQCDFLYQVRKQQ